MCDVKIQTVYGIIIYDYEPDVYLGKPSSTLISEVP